MRQGKAPPDVVCTGRGFHLFRHCANVGPRQGYALVRARSTNIAADRVRSATMRPIPTVTMRRRGNTATWFPGVVIGPTKVVSLFQNSRADRLFRFVESGIVPRRLRQRSKWIDVYSRSSPIFLQPKQN